jgi:hypothetical protein
MTESLITTFNRSTSLEGISTIQPFASTYRLSLLFRFAFRHHTGWLHFDPLYDRIHAIHKDLGSPSLISFSCKIKERYRSLRMAKEAMIVSQPLICETFFVHQSLRLGRLDGLVVQQQRPSGTASNRFELGLHELLLAAKVGGAKRSVSFQSPQSSSPNSNMLPSGPASPAAN